MSKQNLLFHPIISSIQRIALYETKARFYLIGSNNTQTRFRVLKIDRTDSKELILVDDKVEYNKQEIHQLLNMIGFGNRSGRSPGFNKLVSAFGIVGFIRFLEGYYIILVTKRRKIAVIGSHSIYKIEDTAMIYIPNDTSKPLHPDEQRYVKMFLAIDLSTNFYYSYSYDVTHTLQMNMAPPRKLAPALFPKPVTAAVYHSNLNSDKEDCICNKQDDEDIFETWKTQLQERHDKTGEQGPKLEFGVRSVPEWRFVWNSHLLSVVHSQLHPDWILYIIHGFIEQSNLNIFGRPIYLTLIARRSNRYAGTRFLKRGANMHGDVANEVETEQIVHDAMISSFSAGRFSAFVQMRGSIPSFWSQDISKMVPKPAIMIDRSDPFAEIPAKHFNNLMKRYGSPIMILNLVKKREKRKHESLLTEVISNAVKYLNQFLPPENAIQYFHLDMARMNKGADAKVLDKLSAIARTVVRRTGIFLSDKGYGEAMGAAGHQGGRLQTGLARVNCVDCLDRTNTAQFAIGKCVLAHQLYALGLIEQPVIEFDSVCVRLLEGLYEDHGDTLALQYGGSQLVHRIKTYRKTAPWSSHGNDIMQTLSRYYSNTFSDAEKQNTMNLFLGLFVPDPGRPAIWEYPTDYYLHHPETMVYIPNTRSLTKWWDDEVLKFLPRPTNEMKKLCCEIIGMQGDSSALEMIDPYHEYNRPFEYTVFMECFEFKMFHTLRDLAPSFPDSLSPFVVRGRPGVAKGPNSKNPVISGRCSTTSNNSSDSNSDSTSDDDLTSWTASSRQPVVSPLTLVARLLEAEELDEAPSFPAIKRYNSIKVDEPSKRDMLLYRRYVNFERRSNPAYKPDIHIVMTVSSAFTIDSSVDVIPPTVSKASKEIYHDCEIWAKYCCPDKPWSNVDFQNKLHNEHTADLVSRMDILFDTLNSDSVNLRRGKPFSTNLKVSSPHFEFITEMKSYLQSLKFIGAKSTPPSLIGWQWTLNGLMILWASLSQKHRSRKSLATRRLQQDSIENLFGCIRGNCGSNCNPTTGRFVAGLKTAMLSSLAHIGTENCEIDHNDVIVDNFKLLLKNKQHVSFHTEEALASSSVWSLKDIYAEVSEESAELQACAYVRGFLLKNYKNECDKCKSILTSEERTNIHIFTQFKEYKDYQESLNYASKRFVLCVEHCATFINNYLITNAHKKNIMTELSTLLKDSIHFNYLSDCPDHLVHNIDYIIKSVFLITVKRYCTKKIDLFLRNPAPKRL